MSSQIMKSLFGVNSSRSGSGSKKEWTKDEMVIVFGLKAQGAKRGEIADIVGHSVHSVQYVLTTKFAGKSDEEFLAALGCQRGEEVIEKCNALLTARGSKEVA